LKTPTSDPKPINENSIKLYAAVLTKLNAIRKELDEANSALSVSERFFLSHDRYCSELESLGIVSVKWRKTRKIPPHWATPEGPADADEGVVILDPFYAPDDKPNPSYNYETELGLLVPKEIATKILVLGFP
jgi:hypothetical protein